MLKVKLARFGKRNQPHYRIVVNEARDKRDGSYVALIGHYAPTQTPKLLDVNIEEYDKWISQGAQPTDTVAALVERFKSGEPFPAKKKELSKKAKAKLTEEKEAKTVAPEEVKEAPAIEEKIEEATA
jgi:small subunit ribosomal protein S16